MSIHKLTILLLGFVCLGVADAPPSPYPSLANQIVADAAEEAGEDLSPQLRTALVERIVGALDSVACHHPTTRPTRSAEGGR